MHAPPMAAAGDKRLPRRMNSPFLHARETRVFGVPVSVAYAKIIGDNLKAHCGREQVFTLLSLVHRRIETAIMSPRARATLQFSF